MPKPRSDETNMLELLYQALSHPIGSCIAVGNDFEPTRQQLHQARARAMDPDLTALRIIQSPVDKTQAWLLHENKMPVSRGRSNTFTTEDIK